MRGHLCPVFARDDVAILMRPQIANSGNPREPQIGGAQRHCVWSLTAIEQSHGKCTAGERFNPEFKIAILF